MARERYLVGVSEEELRPDPKAEGPKTPRGKLENFWYHYKWHTIATVVAIGILSVLIVQMVTRNDPDYTVVLATQDIQSEAATQKLQATLEAYGRDIDEDGKVEVQVESLFFSGDSQYGMANQTKLMAHLSAADIMFFVFDKTTYEATIVPQQSDNYKFFAPLDVKAEGLEDNGRYWNWKNDALRNDAAMKGMPEDLYFGVRSVSGTSARKSSAKMQEQSMELLRAFLTKKPLTTPPTTAAVTTTSTNQAQ